MRDKNSWHCTRQLSQHEHQLQRIQADKFCTVIDISTKCWTTKVIEYYVYTHANTHREASGINMLVIILIHLLVPGEITNFNYYYIGFLGKFPPKTGKSHIQLQHKTVI